MSKFNIGTGDVLFALAMLAVVGGFRLACRICVWALRALGVM
jgi:hypothetical protein